MVELPASTLDALSGEASCPRVVGSSAANGTGLLSVSADGGDFTLFHGSRRSA